jgi:glyoxylase-like metal-dependent hydrolase (beta-lactamase superfamily II)
LRVVAVHQDVIVATSRLYQTTCTFVRRGTEAFCIDSPILPDELDLLPQVAEQADFKVVGLLATHADWDHVLGRIAFRVPLGVAESTAAVLNADPGAVQRDLRAFDEEHYILRAAPLALGTPQALPVPGRCGLGPGELDLYPLGGHTADGMAIWVPWARVLIVGDHLSPVEIPMLGEAPGSLQSYLETLARLEPLVERAESVIPGHGDPMSSERALAILREDRAYLEALATDAGGAALPLARRSPTQRGIHQRNVTRA